MVFEKYIGEDYLLSEKQVKKITVKPDSLTELIVY